MTRPAVARRPGVRRLSLEVALVGVLLVLYREGRHLAAGHVETAEHNARRVWHVERWLHLPPEGAVQHLLLHHPALVRLADRYYVSVHFPITVAFLLWLWFRHHDSYSRVRLTLAITTGIALVFTVLVPLAPPRLFGGDGLVDTMQVFGPSAYNANTTVGLANQYAAMPSLHVAWAVLVGVTVVGVSTRRWRWVALAHPVLTTLVVVATANHYWSDGIVGLAILGLSAWLVYRPPPMVTRFGGRRSRGRSGRFDRGVGVTDPGRRQVDNPYPGGVPG